jgi:hypothetical protein
MPSCAPRPTATVSAAGTARPMAQGQATTSTATVLAIARRASGGDQPDSEGDSGERQHDGDKDGAGAVGQPLHGRARGLRLLHHARDLGQHRIFAERLRAAGDGAVVVERAGQNASAGLARLRSGLAGEHGFVDRGAAFKNHRVHRKALAGQDQNAVAGLNLFERNDGLNAIENAARRDGTQTGQRVERGQGAALGAAFQALAQKQKSDDQQNRVKVDLAAGSGKIVA